MLDCSRKDKTVVSKDKDKGPLKAIKIFLNK